MTRKTSVKLSNIANLTLYHGSDRQFDKFEYDYIVGDKGNNSDGPGFYLTTSQDDARTYGGHIAVVKASLKHLVNRKGRTNSGFIRQLIIDSPNRDIVLSNYDDDERVALHTATDSIIKYTEGGYDAYIQVWVDFYHRYGKDADKEFLEAMVRQGYDGVMIPMREGVKHYVVFNPNKLSIVEWN